MMVASVAQIAARYNWPVALFNGESSLVTNLNSLGSTMALGQGMVYTSVLFALFFPTAVILRRRAWQIALSHSGNDSMKHQADWLASEQMSFSLPKSWLTGVAILAPVTAGIIPDLTSSIFG
jgi:hypothetical protein